MNKKVISILLIISLVLGNFTSVSAAEKTMYYISAYTTADDTFFALPVLKAEGEAYISVADASKVSGMEHTQNEKTLTFKKGFHKVEYKGKYVSYNGEKYYRMKDIMDALSTIYEYSDKTQSLCFVACKSYTMNLWAECMDIYRNVDYNYSMEYLANTWGVELAVLADILRTGAVDAAWGGYQRGQYEKALSGILLPSQNESSAIALASQANGIMGTFSKGYKAGVDILGEEKMLEALGANVTECMEIYDGFNDMGLNIKLGDCLDMIETIYTAKYASQLYVNGVKYGLHQNKSINDVNLQNATKTVYMHYDDEQPQTADIMNEIGLRIADNTAKDLLEKAITESFGIKNAYLDLMNIVLEEFLHWDKPIEATVQGLMCNEIQKEAIEQFEQCFDTKTASPKNPLQMKYSMLLYLRAAQYAYEQFAFDDSLKWTSDFWIETTQNTINKLAAYSDEELTRKVKNEKVSFKWEGFHSNVEEVTTEGNVTRNPENESTTSDSTKPSDSTTNSTPNTSTSSNGGSSTSETTASGFGMVDLMGKTLKDAKELLKNNGYTYEQDEEFLYISRNGTELGFSFLGGIETNNSVSYIILEFQPSHYNGVDKFQITKELCSQVTYNEAKRVLESEGYKISTTESTKKVYINFDVSKNVSYCKIEAKNSGCSITMEWLGAERFDEWYKTIENYNVYEDNTPEVYISY